MQVLGNATPNLAFSSLLKRYTHAEFWALPEPDDRSHYELIEGVLHIVPPLSSLHGRVIAFLNRSLVLHNHQNQIAGNVYHPREAIYVEHVWGTYLEPDMMYISAEKEDRMGGRRTSADIVFECVSESSSIYDRSTKADTYLALGVKELWLLDPDNETIEIRNAKMQDGVPFWRRRLYTLGESAESIFLNGWAVVVTEIFAK